MDIMIDFSAETKGYIKFLQTQYVDRNLTGGISWQKWSREFMKQAPGALRHAITQAGYSPTLANHFGFVENKQSKLGRGNKTQIALVVKADALGRIYYRGVKKSWKIEVHDRNVDRRAWWADKYKDADFLIFEWNGRIVKQQRVTHPAIKSLAPAINKGLNKASRDATARFNQQISKDLKRKGIK
jgi:hypothetical protein